MEKDRKVRPDCINASNPFHQCTDHCDQRPPGTKLRVEGGRAPAQNGEISREEDGGSGSGRHVDPLCVNASNPFHQCADYCTKRSPDSKKRADGGKSSFLSNHVFRTSSRSLGSSKRSDGGKSAGVMTGERKVDPNCVNASNPFHECAEHCTQKIQSRSNGVKSVVSPSGSSRRSIVSPSGSNRRSNIVVENRDVNPQCVNASNPYHKCGEHCMQRIRDATS